MNSKQPFPSVLLITSFLNLTFATAGLLEPCRRLLGRILFAFLAGQYKGVIAPIEQVHGKSYASGEFRSVFSRAKFLTPMLSMILNRYCIKWALELANRYGLPIHLSIDDTLIPKDKRSKLLAKGGMKGNIVGFSFVTATIAVGGLWIPLVPRQACRKDYAKTHGLEYVSKIQLATDFIDFIASNGLANPLVTLLLDSWYLSTKVIKVARRAGWSVVGATKCNRRFTRDNPNGDHGKSSRVEDLRHGCKRGEATRVRDDRYVYDLFTRQGTLRGLDERVTILLSKRTSHDGTATWKYIVAVGSSLSAVEILQEYSKRWVVETFHQIWEYRYEPRQWRLRGKQQSESVIRIDRLCFVSVLSMICAVHWYQKRHSIDPRTWASESNHCLVSTSLEEIRCQIHSLGGGLKI